MIYYAHTADHPDGSRDLDETHWQPLRTHPENVAEPSNDYQTSERPAANT